MIGLLWVCVGLLIMCLAGILWVAIELDAFVHAWKDEPSCVEPYPDEDEEETK